MRAKLKAIREELRKRRHLPLPEQGKWLGAVVRGYFAYHAVPTNGRIMRSFRVEVIRYWLHALQGSLRISPSDRDSSTKRPVP